MKERILYKLNSFIIILMFCIAIFIPFLIGVFEKDKTLSSIEKRQLLQLPEIPKTINDIQAFPQTFDNYYSDQFGLRDWFIEYYKLTKFSIGDSPSEDVTIGKNGWYFLGSTKVGYKRYDDPIGDVRNINLYSQQDLKRLGKYMEALKTWLNNKGTEYVLVIVPNKHTVYFDQLPDYISKINDKSATDQLIEYLTEHTDIKVVDLRDQLIREKETHSLYPKTDSHWNHYGANIAQYEIMLEIEKLFPGQIQPEMKKLRTGTQGGGNLANLMGIHTLKEHNPQPIFDQTCIPTRHPPDAKEMEPHTLICKNQKLNAVIFRDSCFSELQPYFSRKFKRSTYIWGKLNFSSLAKYVKLEKPDIVIEQWSEKYLPYIPKDSNEFTKPLNKKKFDNSRVPIFSNDWKQLKFTKHLKLIDDENGSLQLRAIGNAPIITFPVLPIKPNNEYIMHIELTSSVQSTLKVFYSDTNQSGYPFSEKHSLRLSINKGDNDIYIALDYPKLGKNLRLDPISELGEIEIKSLVIKRVENPF